MEKADKSFDRWDVFLSGLLAGGSLLLYGRTLVPGLLPGDGGEFQTLAVLWGHSHPTGYPVYLTLAHLFTLLPTGEMAYRVNLFSAGMGAVTAVGLYLSGRIISQNQFVPLAGTLVLIVSPTFWSQAVIAELYTTGAAFFIWIIALLLAWQKNGRTGALFAASLLGGLSLGVHMTVALLAPAALLFVVAVSLNRKTAQATSRNLKTAVFGAVSGLAITILLFLVMNWHNPPANYFSSVVEPSRSAWGLAAEQIDSPLEKLWFGWSARQFRPFMFANVREVMPQQAADYWHNLPAEVSWPLILLAGFGTIYLMVTQWPTAVFLLVALITQLFTFFNYAIWDLYVFYIPSYLLLILLGIAGMGGVAAAATKYLPGRRAAWLGDAAVATAVFVFAVWPTFQPRQDALAAGQAEFDFTEYSVYDETVHLVATAVVRDLPDRAILFTDWEMMWPYYYAAVVENGRTDLTFIETYPADDQEEIAASLLAYVAANLPDHPIYFTERDNALREAGYSFSPARIGPARLVKIREE